MKIKNTLEKVYNEHIFVVVILFSFLITLLAMPLYDITRQIDQMNTYQLLLFIFNIACIISFITIYIIYKEKNKRMLIILILFTIGFLINIMATIDLYFLKVAYIVVFLGILNIIPSLIIINQIIDILQINSEFITFGLWLFLYILTSNIIVTIVFKFLNFRNNKKNVLLTLYYLQGNIAIINILSIYFMLNSKM